MEKDSQKVIIAMLPTNDEKDVIFKTDNRLEWENRSFDQRLLKYNESTYHLYFILGENPIKGDWFLWKNEIHKFHSDAGYGIKTYTDYNEKDGSSKTVNWSNCRGTIIATTDSKLSFRHCQRQEESESECETQCDHCKEYYRPVDRIVPKPTNQFVIDYCKRGGIDAVKVEYVKELENRYLKVNSDNEITTHILKEYNYKTFENVLDIIDKGLGVQDGIITNRFATTTNIIKHLENKSSDNPNETSELIDCIHNLMGFFDTPLARLKMQSKDCEEVRQIGRDVLKKYGVNYRGL
jgi:hypothetical protein